MKLIQHLFSFSFFALVCCISCAQDPPPGTPANNMELFASGLSNTVAIAHAGDSRLFVVDQSGYVRIVDQTGQIKTQVFLDIRNKVTFGGERGLLGLAFHPQYKTNGYFYVNYVGAGDSTNISRFKVNAANPDIADPQSEHKLMTIYQPYANHNGGTLSFGPDGFLYIGLGDGGSGGDPQNRAQNPGTFLGKMLRIDVNNGTRYAIPATNPFVNSTTTLPEIWALGLRNPWKFSFDRLTGDLWIADVGQNAVEEVNFQPATSPGGENYGWRCYEGNQTYNNSGCAPAASLTFPVYAYPQGDECSVTGGYVYRGNTSSTYYGHYFFTDYCSDRIWTLRKVANNWVKEDFGRFTGNNFGTFGEDSSGQLYVAGRGSGRIYRVVGGATGIKDDVLAGVKILQVPHSTKIRIETGENKVEEMRLTLSDMKGAILYSATMPGPDYEFDPGSLAFGVYILNIVMGDKKLTHKLVKGNF